MSSGNITYVVDKLEQKKLVSRRACTEDRRLIFAEITEAGKQWIEEVFPGHTEVIERAVDGLSAEEKQAAAQLLKNSASMRRKALNRILYSQHRDTIRSGR